MVLIITQIGATIGWVMLGFAPNIAVALSLAPIAVVFVARIIEGVSGGNISITQAYVADLVERARTAPARSDSSARCSRRAWSSARPSADCSSRASVSPRLSSSRPGCSSRRSRSRSSCCPSRALVSRTKNRRAPYRVLSRVSASRALRGSSGRTRDLPGALRLVRRLRALSAAQLGFSLTQTDYFFSVFAILNVFL